MSTPTPHADIREDDYLVWSNEHNAWWRPNRQGYTINRRVAGRYTRDEAISICAHARDGWGTGTALPSEIPVRAADADACDAAFEKVIRSGP